MHPAPGKSRAIISYEKLSQIQRKEHSTEGAYEEEELKNDPPKTTKEPDRGWMNFLVFVVIAKTWNSPFYIMAFAFLQVGWFCLFNPRQYHSRI